eukprot:s6112_g4.t1
MKGRSGLEGHWQKRQMVGAELERGFGQRMQTEHVERAVGSRPALAAAALAAGSVRVLGAKARSSEGKWRCHCQEQGSDPFFGSSAPFHSWLRGPCAAFGASTAHSDSNHCGPRLRARRPRDLADFRQYLLSRSEGGPVNFDAWVQAQHVDSSLGQCPLFRTASNGRGHARTLCSSMRCTTRVDLLIAILFSMASPGPSACTASAMLREAYGTART